MSTPVTNFGKTTVSLGYNAADVSIVLITGHGSRLPSTFPYPLVWWNATDFPDPADDPSREIVIVTARASDTLTVTRAGESTSASVKNIAGKTYRMALGITKGMWDSLSERALSQTFRGLRCGTDPDSTLKLSSVFFTADSIVMDDGEEVAGWNNMRVSLAASGLNGLDTGSEGASRGYELYAIYNGVTKAGLLHRAKDYLLDEDVSAGEDSEHALRRGTAPLNERLANGFQVDTAGLCEFVDVKLKKTGSPTGDYWFTIEATSGGVPSGTPLATSDKMDYSRQTTTATWTRVLFRTPATLSAATQYHLVMYGNCTISDANYLAWRGDLSAAAYARGSKASYNGSWTNDTDDDFTFKIYITENDTALTLPSGYTQYALICPLVYNDSGSNLKPFRQWDRRFTGGIYSWWDMGVFSNSNALIHMAGYAPPRPVLLRLTAYNSGAAVHLQAGPLECLDLSGGLGYVANMQMDTSSGSNHHTSIPPFLCEYQGFMAWMNASGVYVSGFDW